MLELVICASRLSMLTAWWRMMTRVRRGACAKQGKVARAQVRSGTERGFPRFLQRLETVFIVEWRGEGWERRRGTADFKG